MCVWGLIRYSCGTSTNHWLRCPDVRDGKRSVDNTNEDDLLSTLCKNIVSGPLIDAPNSRGCGHSRCPRPTCRTWLNEQKVLISDRRNEIYRENQRRRGLPKGSGEGSQEADRYYLGRYPEELRRGDSQMDQEKRLDEVFSEPFRDYLELQRSQPPRAAHGEQDYRDAAFKLAFRSKFGSQGQELGAWAGINDSLERYCYTHRGMRHSLEGFRVVLAGADQQGGPPPPDPQEEGEMHQDPVDEQEMRVVVRRKVGEQRSRAGEADAVRDRVQEWLDSNRCGAPGYS